MIGLKKAKRALATAPEEFRFFLHDGRVLANLIDLRDALSNMSQETFSRHVNADKNDFAVWVEQVLQDGELGLQLKRVKTQKTAKQKVADRINKCYV